MPLDVRKTVKSVPMVRPTVRTVRAAAGSLARTWRRLTGRFDARAVARLRNVHRGRAGWIVGNGPSLRRMDLSVLAGEITFCCNSIFLLFDRIDWRPTYYFVEDVLVAEDNASTIAGLRGMHKIFPRDLRRLFREDPETTYVEFIRGDYLGFPRFSDRCDRCVYWGGTVLYMMLQLAAWMGCNPIYIIGADMTYAVPEGVEGNVIVSSAEGVNHFHPAYFGPGKRWHKPNVPRMIRCIAHARRHLADRGVGVYNAGLGGNLDVLPRVAYDRACQDGPVSCEPHR